MKKLYLILLSIMCILLVGCSDDNNKNKNKFINIEANENNEVVIDTTDITSNATFINYEISDKIVQLIVVRGTDDIVRIALNTCQSCNPSPNAYFVQKGEYLECQNCGTKFHINKIGEEKGGCNPTPIQEKESTDNKIIITKEQLDKYKDKFTTWNGITE